MPLSNIELLKKEMENELENIEKEQKNLFNNITNMLDQKKYLESKISGLSKLIPTLKIVKSEAQQLVNTINEISDNSEEISGKIRSLDTARCRVTECQQRVGDLIDLEICSKGVQAAILDSDYETGAAHVHRFLSIDQNLLEKTATDVESATNMMKSVRTLQEATNQIRAIVEHKFGEAVKNEDLPAIERFFKIFPLLKMHKEGIVEFCNYLRGKIALTAEKNFKCTINTPPSDKRYTIVYADTLTLLFEGVARIIDTHQPLIETYYGLGRLILAIEVLQKECDLQMKRILNEWTKNRKVNRKIQQIRELSRNPNKLDKIQPKDLDMLIGEVALMHFRTELYIRFIRRKVMCDLEIGVADKESKATIKNSLDILIKTSDLTVCKHELLSYYLNLEQYFMEESVGKAVLMDNIELNQQISSMVDDTFFIVKKCIRRSISSGSLDGICAIINNSCTVLENDYCNVLRCKLKQGYPSGYLDLSQAYNVLQSSIQQGRLQSGDTEQSRLAFLVALNNADNSIEYVETLCQISLKEIEQALPNMIENEKGKLESCLSGLSSIVMVLKEIINFGVQQLKTTVIKPRINPWVDGFLNINHQLTDDELSLYEAGESFVQCLIMNLEQLLATFKDILTASNYDAFISVLTTEITQRMETVILKTTFNRLGGLILDKEIRSLAGYITTITNWSVRDKFARLTQIATILNLENINEIYDYWGEHDAALTWRLTPTELRTVMMLRTDFKIDDIKKLKL